MPGSPFRLEAIAHDGPIVRGPRATYWENKWLRAPAIPTLILVFFAADTVLGAAYICNFWAGEPSEWLSHQLDLDGEANLPTWYSSIKWFCVAALFAIIALSNGQRTPAKSWPVMGLALLFLALSLDEVAGIHEWLGRQSDALLPNGTRAHTIFETTGIWIVLAAPFGLILGGLTIRARHYFTRDLSARAKFIFGMALFLFGALAIEMVSNFIAYNVYLVFAEELSEMLGSTIVLWGIYELMHARLCSPRN